MKYKWLNNSKNTKLIVFFNGWGMDENIVSHLNTEDYDILMFYDYNTIESNFNFDHIKDYQEKNLISWSMGVLISYIVFNSINIYFDNKVAINGTLKPIDEKYGIHPKIYDLTIKGFNTKGQEKFINSMFSEQNNFSIDSITRDLENQKIELISIKNFTLENNSYEKEFFNKILISNNDKIIPTKSQVEFWQKEANVASGHCPFYLYNKWSELL